MPQPTDLGLTLLMQGQEITRLRALIACALEIITRHKASLCDPCTCEADVLAALRGEGEK